MSKSKKFNIYFFIISSFVFIITVIRSIYTSITYDESLTYLNFVINKWDFSSKLLANNHLINTFFIFVFDKITSIQFSEFIIRLPNILFYIMYIVFTYKISKLYKNPYLISSVLLLNYSVNEFFGLARGYGIASSIILFGVYYYKKWLVMKKMKYLNISLISLLFSSLANTITLIAFGIFFLDSIFRIKKEKMKINKFSIMFFILLIFLEIIMVGYHFYVIKTDHNIAHCSNSLLYCIIKTPIHYYGFNYTNSYLIITIFILSFIFFIYYYKYLNFKKENIWYIGILFLFAFILCKLCNFQIPSGRSLIPFLGIYIICIIDYITLFSNLSFEKYIEILIIILCFISFFSNLNTYQVREWKEDSKTKEFVDKKFHNKQQVFLKEIDRKQIIGIIFYHEKYCKYYNYKLIDDVELVKMLESI